MIAPASYNPALAALRHHISGAVARGEAEPITEIPAASPRVDTAHGRHCICHRCAPVPAKPRVWIKRGANEGIATIFNQGKV